ncbi:BamA/TamA family outer membrane protein [Mangrovibacterium diazotrophicum]|nr:BamA/TamA family outer membrane protein [Mangrovibacterium diazotrophicum]
MNKIILFFLFLSIFSPSKAQTSTRDFESNDDPVNFSLFLIGNCGKFSSADSQQVKLMNQIMKFDRNKKGIIFLGNNFYPSFSDLFSEDVEDKKPRPQLNKLKQFNGPICFVAGWSDWSYGASNGKEMVKWEYKTINKTLKNEEVYMPDGGCPGPKEVFISDSITLVLIDTQWWMHPFDTRMGKCDMEDKADFWNNLRDVLRRNRDKQVVVAGYHPPVSYGEYGGYFSPFVQIIGFPYVFMRKNVGSRLDLSHPLYSEFSEGLKSVLEEFPNIIYASSHERNFQYFTENKVHYIIGGSLTGGDYVKSKETSCSSRDGGLARLDFHASGEVELKFFSIENPEMAECNEIVYDFSTCEEHLAPIVENQTFADSMVALASTRYDIDPKHYKWVGENYRDIWSTPIKAPVFDIMQEKGGLVILKRGGGQQTKSLRLKATNKHQYTLRSIEKDVEGAVSSELANTFAIEVLQDNISASNPYAALVAAQLAEVAGVMHTNPEVVYVPRDYRMEEYTEDLANMLFLFEERPAGDWSDQKSFGYSKEIVGTDDVLDQTEESANNHVDQKAVLRARILDTFLNDWDRHDDQWRWASFMENGETIYRPIPRDRDQAFYVNQGRLPWLVTRKWLMPKFQGFGPMTENMNGLAFNARYFDRTFLTEPDWNNWATMLDSLTMRLTDEKIRAATQAFPKEVQPLCADSTADILIARKANMGKMIREHYLSLAKNVNITGTNENDIFHVERLANGQTDVQVWNSDRTILEYHRLFNNNETKEIRLYGLKGNDKFVLNGNQKSGSKIRLIGGKDDDSFQNNSIVSSGGNQVSIYDNKKGTNVTRNQDTRVHLSNHEQINYYDRMDFKYDVVKPGVLLGFNPDDAVFIGGGPIIYKYRFRRHEVHTIMANIATLTAAFNALYQFESFSENGGWDHHIGIDMKAPNYAMNYFGMGNKSTRNSEFDRDYYQMRINQTNIQYSLGKRWGQTAFEESEDGTIKESELQVGLFVKRSHIKEPGNDFISNLSENELTADDLEQHVYSGVRIGYTTKALDRESNPQRGYLLNAEARQSWRIDGPEEQFTTLSGDFRAYLSFTRNPRTVVVLRVGGEKIFNDHFFLESATLGGKTNLRGYLGDRFYGDASFYQNTELRYKIHDFKSVVLNGEYGLLGLFDSGRVWLSGEKSDYWHKGFGAGLWVSPFDMTILTASYNWSNDDRIVQVTLNFKL